MTFGVKRPEILIVINIYALATLCKKMFLVFPTNHKNKNLLSLCRSRYTRIDCKIEKYLMIKFEQSC